jgi:DNA-binding NarL/FixJ family response regulator
MIPHHTPPAADGTIDSGPACCVPIRIALLEEHQLLGSLIRDGLAVDPRFQIVHWLRRACEVPAVVGNRAFDVLLMELELAVGDGVRLAADAHRIDPELRIIAVTANVCPVRAWQVRQGRFAGIIDKRRQGIDDLRQAIHDAMAGRFHVAPAMVAEERRMFSDPCAFYKVLSPREMQVLRILGLGLDNRSTARLLHLSVHTVQGYRSVLRRKLGLRTARELTAYVLEQGLLRSDQFGAALRGRVPRDWVERLPAAKAKDDSRPG